MTPIDPLSLQAVLMALCLLVIGAAFGWSAHDIKAETDLRLATFDRQLARFRAASSQAAAARDDVPRG